MTSPVPLELQEKIASWRLRSAEGSLTLEEMKAGIVYLRAGRVQAASASAVKRKKSIAAIPSAQDMLSELEGL